jgi:hypothetical protein
MNTACTYIVLGPIMVAALAGDAGWVCLTQRSTMHTCCIDQSSFDHLKPWHRIASSHGVGQKPTSRPAVGLAAHGGIVMLHSDFMHQHTCTIHVPGCCQYMHIYADIPLTYVTPWFCIPLFSTVSCCTHQQQPLLATIQCASPFMHACCPPLLLHTTDKRPTGRDNSMYPKQRAPTTRSNREAMMGS